MKPETGEPTTAHGGQEHVILLYEQGCSPTEIAAQLRMSCKRVREFLKGPPSPPVYKQRSTQARSIQAYLKQRFAEDGRGNSLQLYREVFVKATMDVVVR